MPFGTGAGYLQREPAFRRRAASLRHPGFRTIFLTNCNLSCVFCQNYPISQMSHGNAITVEYLSSSLLTLQDRGAHNINFVSPTHMSAHVADAIHRARNKGLSIPIVWNSGGYEDVETLKLLEGFVDIYLPDAKYSSSDSSKKYSGAEDYWTVNQKALKEMHRQVGNLTMNEEGIAIRGLLIRHLVLPSGISGSKDVLRFIAEEISKDTFISLMAQYHPAHRSHEFPELERRLTEEEYQEILEFMIDLGLENGWQQEL